MRLKALVLISFLLLLLSNVPNAASPIPPVCSNPNLIPDLSGSGIGIQLALLALTLSFDVVAIAFAVSRMFPHLGIRNWLGTEYWEIAKSAIIIVSIYGAITFIGNLSYALVPSAITAGLTNNRSFADITPLIMGAEGYLCNVNANLTNAWGEIGIMADGTRFWSTVQVGFYVQSPPIFDLVAMYDGANFLPFSNWMLQTGNFFIAAYGSIINDFVNFILFPFTALTIGLIETMPAFAYVGLTFFIPLGLAFRALPFIRGIGGTLIAIGVALCMVLPATFLLFNYQATSLVSSTLPIAVQAPPTLLTNPGCSSQLGGFGFFSTLICFISPLLNSVISVANSVSSIWQSAVVFQTTAIYTYLNKILNIGFYMILQMLLFVLDLVIMYPLVDGIAKAMGGTIRLSLGGKLKLAS